MAKKKKKKFTITKKDLILMDKRATRNTLLEAGSYNIHREKKHKDKSKYSRKNKHKGGKND